MSRREKISIVRSDDFEEVDAALSEALASLEAANARVSQLLESETCSQLSEAAERKLTGLQGEPGGEEGHVQEDGPSASDAGSGEG